ncbi:hypothetical protein RFI_12407 [Reticulomyxa filosa]|uniref:START domain-containing protein n=1 Tax=Reticulomyxa filosa TaxID=46433 RepID=X6NEJ2_RETFI|nr:hypothetical protein RFI_12407 [Reticulomyxa filosa]|eukprot:ETO24750.1 hypothetical protein RFI_12407 [Reticulomyxa filosa]
MQVAELHHGWYGTEIFAIPNRDYFIRIWLLTGFYLCVCVFFFWDPFHIFFFVVIVCLKSLPNGTKLKQPIKLNQVALILCTRKETDKDCRFVYVVNIDPKGWLPAKVVDIAAPGQANVALQVKKISQSFGLFCEREENKKKRYNFLNNGCHYTKLMLIECLFTRMFIFKKIVTFSIFGIFYFKESIINST